MRKVIVTCMHKEESYSRQIIEEIFGSGDYKRIEYFPKLLDEGEEKYLAKIKESENPVAIIDIHDDRGYSSFRVPGPGIIYLMHSPTIEKRFLPLLEALLKGKDLPYTSIYLDHRNVLREYPIMKAWSWPLFHEDHTSVQIHNLQSVLLPIELVKK